MNLRDMSIILNKKECMNKERKIIYGYNRVRIHNKYETKEHFMTKALLTHMIFSRTRNGVMTEADMRDGRSIDVLQVAKNGDLVGYEIENGKNTKNDVDGVDFVEINLKKMPKKAKEGIKELENWLKVYLI